jgi:hypothetical protein
MESVADRPEEYPREASGQPMPEDRGDRPDRPDDRGQPERPRPGAAGPEQTQPLPGGQPAPSTRPGQIPPPADPWLTQAATQVHPMAGEIRSAGGGGETAMLPRDWRAAPPGGRADRPGGPADRAGGRPGGWADQPAGRTRRMSPVDPDAGPEPRWAGRAAVGPGPGAGHESGPGYGYDEYPPATQQWERPDDSGRGPWWMPVVVGFAILILLALIGLGIWFALGSQGGGPGPAGTSTPTTSPTAAASPSPSPSPSPTTASPSPSVAPVNVPPLAGVPLDDAKRLLDQANLSYTVVSQPDPTVPAGVVIETQPGAGTPLTPGSQVTIVVSTGAPSPSPSPSPSAS